MSGALSPDPPSTPRRLGALLLVLAIMFLAGAALTATLAQRLGWFARAPVPIATPAARVATAPPIAAPVPAPATDPTMLATRELMLSAQLAALESRTAIVAADADAASGQAGRAEAMLVAFASRRAIDRGLGLGGLEAPLRARFGGAQPRAVELIVQGARERVTLEDLRGGLDALATGLLSGGSGNWWIGLRRALGGLIVIHAAGTPSALPADRLARVERLVETGQVEAALAEVERMPGAANAANWIAAAHRYVEVHRALDTIESAAVLGQAIPSAPAPPNGAR